MIADDAFLARRLAWLTALRLTLLSALLAVVGFLYLRERQVAFAFSAQVVLSTVGAGFTLAAIFAALLRVKRWLVPLTFAQLVFDQVAWTIIAYVSGGVASPAMSLYGLTCVIGAVVAGVRGVLVASVSASLLVVGLGFGLASGRLSPPRDQLGMYAVSFRDVSYHLAITLLALVVVSLLAGYLAERLRSTGGELVRATARAEEAERLAMLGRFAAGLAHEIRNPLGSIAGSIDLLATGAALGEEDKVLCAIISREASRLNDLVTDMLDLAKPRRPERTSVDVAALASEVTKLAARSGRGSDVRVVCEVPAAAVTIDADASQLRQILWNLVRNAVQASRAGATVVVRVLRVSASVHVEVEDDGPGIPSAAREQLFDAFFTTRTHGIGIGLAVVKRIVEDHGFRIEVDDGKPSGAVFRVVIPAAATVSLGAMLDVPPLAGPVDRTTLVILRCGDPVASVAERRGPFARWIAAPMRRFWEGPIVELDVRASEPDDALLEAGGLVLTGSSSSVTERAGWMLATEALLGRAVARDVPVLGICFGHQLLAQALGGEVRKNARGREIGSVHVRSLGDDPLFAGLAPSFTVNATHVDTIATRPPGARVLAETLLEPTAAFQIGSARGVQFHPEIDGDVMRGYLEARRPILTDEGFDVDAMIAAAADAPAGDAILANFARTLARR